MPHSAETCLQLNALDLYRLMKEWEEQAMARESVWLQDPVAAAFKHCAKELQVVVAQQELRAGPQ